MSNSNIFGEEESVLPNKLKLILCKLLRNVKCSLPYKNKWVTDSTLFLQAPIGLTELWKQYLGQGIACRPNFFIEKQSHFWHTFWKNHILFNPFSANPTKWSNTLTQFIGCCWRIVWVCLTILWGWRLKDYPWISGKAWKSACETLGSKSFINFKSSLKEANLKNVEALELVLSYIWN